MLIHVLLSSLLRATKHYSRYQVLLRKLQVESATFILHFFSNTSKCFRKLRMS